jgi:hypothetical protein
VTALAGALIFIAAGWLTFVHGVTRPTEVFGVVVAYILAGTLMAVGISEATRRK